MKRIIVLVCSFAALATARVIVVPDSAATIAAGLSAAYSGDTVLVMPGTYSENLTWPSRDGISLVSSAGPESTTVDGQSVGTCLTMGSGSLTRATLVQGFTFANGYNAGGGAAGISCAGNATIRGNRVTRCNGVGIYLESYSGSFSPLVDGNEIDGCFKEVEGWNYGCGMYVDAPSGALPEIRGNYIHHDTLRNSARNYGGGIYLDADALVYQNVIEANVLLSDTGSACRAYGAGIYVDMSRKPVIFANLIKDNKCATDAWKYGAGIRTNLYAKPYIIGNTIVGNVCAGPHMWSDGGGIYNDIGCTTYVRNNIVANNQATNGPGIYNEAGSGGVINSSHNDYYNNALYGCSYGPGDITGNPLFVSGPGGDYYVSQVAAGQGQNSPCLDAGDTLGMTVPVNLDSLFRTWTTRTDSIIDMDLLDIGFHYPGGVPLGVEESRQLTANSRQLPTVVRGVLFLAEATSLKPQASSLLDAAGRRVMSLRPGRNDVAHLAPGVYLVRPAAVALGGKPEAAERIVIIR